MDIGRLSELRTTTAETARPAVEPPPSPPAPSTVARFKATRSASTFKPASSLTRKGVDLIKSFEGLRLRAYRDPGGVWTIGYGHTGSDVHPGQTITTARASQLLAHDTGWAQDAVRSSVKVPLTSAQFDALTSFTFNLGAGALRSSTLLQKLNARDYAGAQHEFGRWVHAGGVVLAGLVRRRAAEAKLFGSTGPRGTPPSPIPPSRPTKSVDYRVRAGDTFGGIAASHHLTTGQLAKLNPQVRDLNLISVGQKLCLSAGRTRAPTPAPAPHPPAPAPGPVTPHAGIPNTSGLSQGQRYAVYEKYIAQFGDAQSRSDLAAGKRVILALRKDTPMTADQPFRGTYDDRMVVMWKDSHGAHVQELAANTEPNRRWAIPANGSSKPVGRLADNQTIRYHKAWSSKFGDHLEPSGNPFAQRDANRDYRFEKNERSYNGDWGGQAMFVHRAWSTDTGSQGCQTMEEGRFNTFWGSLGSQSDFSYVLVNVS